ncbi:Ubiquitin receptor b [Sesamum angolense]|uniref:Ubiquitin receptor RAD23 n=1 Tax=Sesamum angolense TaxID=2727404 RepID=A0AAE2BRT7_9LAMI|nr:Ubiquitin receptor b [Sesamum angolense]
MKLTVKTLKGSHFQISVQLEDAIIAVKKNIEDVQGKDNYPCDQQLLIHNGKVLKDESTLAENKVSEDGFLVVMLTKARVGDISQPPAPVAASAPNPTCAVDAQPPALAPRSSEPASIAPTTNDPSEPYAQAASNVVAGDNLEVIIQQLIDMGGGSWDKETVIRALRAAYNNPERAVDYLYSGVPKSTEIAVPSAQPAVDSLTASGAANAPPTSGAPNSSPLDLFPQETVDGAGLGSLDFLRNNEQPMLQELGKQNPSILRLIQENQQEFLQLINEPVDDSEGDIFDQGDEDMPHAVSVTPAEEAAIERMEAMGFDRALVIEAFLACDRNEELALNYLLENAADFEG